MSDFQEARTKRAIFAAMEAERRLEELSNGLIYRSDVEEANTAALELLERLGGKWARDTARRIAPIANDMAAIHAELSAATDKLLRDYSNDLGAMARADQ